MRLAHELNEFRARSISELAGVRQRPPEQWGGIFFDYPDTWRILTIGPEQIVGFWQVVPMRTVAWEMTRQGRSTVTLSINEIFQPIDRPGWYDVLIYSISVDPQFRNLFTGMLLANSMIRAFADLARRGVMFREVIASIVSRYGLLINHGLGFDLQYVADHETVGKVYAGHLPSILSSPIAKESSDVDFRRLCEIYAAHPSSPTSNAIHNVDAPSQVDAATGDGNLELSAR